VGKPKRDNPHPRFRCGRGGHDSAQGPVTWLTDNVYAVWPDLWHEHAMPEGFRGGSLIVAPGRSHCWPWALCLPRERLPRLALLVCVAGLLALLVSAISPADDSLQPDLSRHFRNGHRVVTASKLLQASHLLRPNRAAAANTFGAHAGPVRHPADHSILGPPASTSSPGFKRSLAARAPPACSSCSVWRRPVRRGQSSFPLPF